MVILKKGDHILNYLRKILIITMLLIALIYTVNITNIPEKIILFEQEELNLNKIFGIVLKENEEQILEASSSNNNIEKRTVTVSLFNIIDVKQIEISKIENVKVVPLGNTVGIKLYSDGVLVIGMSEIKGQKPYENSGIKEGDLITKVDNVEITTTGELIETVNKSEGKEIEIKYIRENEEYVTTILPVKADDDNYKIGLWVRDGAVGIGTATYYEPETGKVATLGHGIVDRDTDNLITIEKGEFLTSTITKIQKGEKGNPGEIKGIIGENIIGSIDKNTEFGIYGNLLKTSNLNANENQAMEVALREEIKTGKATILLCLEDGIRKEYEIEIKKIYRNNLEDNKSMLIEITDEELISKTGGIIQGMSGAPIMQNGKFVRSNNTCPCKQPKRRICSIWRNNDKGNERIIKIY